MYLTLQVLASTVQSRIIEALAKPATATASEQPDSSAQSLTLLSHPSSVSTTSLSGSLPLPPPPLTSTLPLNLVSKAACVSTSPYLINQPSAAPKRGVVITKLPGHLSASLMQEGMHIGGDKGLHVNQLGSSSLASGDDPQLQLQSLKESMICSAGLSLPPWQPETGPGKSTTSHNGRVHQRLDRSGVRSAMFPLVEGLQPKENESK